MNSKPRTCIGVLAFCVWFAGLVGLLLWGLSLVGFFLISWLGGFLVGFFFERGERGLLELCTCPQYEKVIVFCTIFQIRYPNVS